MLGLARRERNAEGRIRLRFNRGRIAATLAVLAVAGWLAAGTAVYFFIKYGKEFPEIRYSDAMLLPFRFEEVRRKMGDFNVQQSREAMKAGEFMRAYLLARNGVSRNPENLEGRIFLSRFLLLPALNRRDLAVRVLEEGIQYGGEDIAYLRNFFQVMLLLQEDDIVRETAEKLLPAEPEPTERNRLAALAAAQANYFRGNFDAAQDLIGDYFLAESPEGLILSARISWERGREQLATDRLEAYLQRNPDDDRVYALLSRFFRESEEYRKALRIAVMRMANNPLRAEPRIEIIHCYHHLGRTEQRDREIAELIDQFRSDEGAMQALANYATDTGNTSLSRRLYEIALEYDFDVSVFALLFIESNVVSGNYDGAITFAEELDQENPDWLENAGGVFNSLRAVAYYGQGNTDLGKLFLSKFLQEQNLRIETMLAVSRRFVGLGNRELARTVLQSAYELDPTNQAALTGLVEIDLALGNAQDLPYHLRRLLRMRRPSYEIIRDAYRALNSDRFLFVRDRENLLLDLREVIRESEGGDAA